MANTLSFTVDSITADRTEGVLLDGTTYTSPVRSGVGLFVTGQKMTHESVVEETLTVTPNDADPETDSEFTFTIPKDGWLRFLIAAIPDFNAASTYSIYDAVYDATSGKVYRSKQNLNVTDTLSDTAWWEEITDPGSLASNEGEANESTNIDSLIYEPLIVPNSEYGFGNQIATASEKYLTSLNIPDADLATYTLLAVLLDGAYIRGDRSLMSQGERIVRRLESILETLE